MKKRAHFITEIVLGLVLTAALSWTYFTRSTFVETTSLRTYDFLSTFRPPIDKSNIIKIVQIDEEALNNIGRWPWPRTFVAELIDGIIDSGADTVGLNILYTEQDQNEGLEEIARLQEVYAGLLDQYKRAFRRKKIRMGPFEDFLFEMEDSMTELDGDTRLSQSIDEAGNIVLPMYFVIGDAGGENLTPLPEFFQSQSVNVDQANAEFVSFPDAFATTIPVDIFGSSSAAIGHSNMTRDQDGTLRRIAPTVKYGDTFYPSFGMQIVRLYKKLPLDAFTLKSPTDFSLRTFDVPIDEEGKNFLEFAGSYNSFDRYSALEVLMGSIPEDALENKIVLVGVTAPGISQNYVIPTGEVMTGLDLWATHIDNILNQRFIKRPEWASSAEWGTIGLAALVVVFLLPFVRARFSIPIAALIFAGLLGGSFFLFAKEGLWVTPAYGCMLLAIGFVIIVGKRLIFTEKSKELVEAEGVETNKMLGLSFQGQGMLDLAFEKFRKCEIDDQMKDLLYNLALDMERKRMFSKAAAVHEHIATEDPKYKDIQDKIQLLKKAGEGAVFGGIGKKGSDATVVVEGLGQFTTLGRYEVVKELGRGAMGIVYLGKDPKINRQVAIKTLRFEDEVDEDQAKSIKERFFREAESAGNLTHPNIIRIFDAGEDQDVAYIAMELIEGQDLKHRCEKGNLFPLKQTVEYVAQVADALDYAHKQGVVHRDIKPPNIMLLKDGTLRITDFGIARIQAASKTATGAVLGTPAYMSPEQVNGKKVDGRADIFSLGVTLFEMLTGEKPFAADSIAALLYRIANVDHPDPREFNSNIPESLIPILDKSMAKDFDKRYQKAGEMAADLRKALASMPEDGAAPTDPPPPPPAPATEKDEPAPVKEEKKTDPAPKPVAPEPVQEVVTPPPPPPPIEVPVEAPADNTPLESTTELSGVTPDPTVAPAADEKPGEPTSSLEESDFLSELKDVLGPDEPLDKTVVIPEDQEKTVVLPPETPKPKGDVPVDNQFEGTFQPPGSPPDPEKK